jgi:hypothetical protein
MSRVKEAISLENSPPAFAPVKSFGYSFSESQIQQVDTDREEPISGLSPM